MSTERLRASLADRYRLERELGQGGMATVYLAADLKHDRQVAIKVLRPELAAVLGAERFVQEIRTTAALSHPHILPLFDSGTADGFLYYVMPYVQGETLRTRLDREKQLGVDEAVKITTEVADALDYAHRQGVVHRDIKPENILLHDGRPMVADFGIALAVSAAAGGRMTETGLSLGTPHYMSPEQATAEKEITARSDVYSLASVLYEMLTGNPPHTGASAQQIIMKIVTDQARPVTELRKAVPPNVAAALAKALEKLPADRFDSARAFAEALANPGFRTAGVPAATPPAALPPHRLIALLALGVVLALAAAAWGWLRSPPARPVARYGIALPKDEPIGGPWARLALTPDGSRIIYSTSHGSRTSLWVRARDALMPTELAGTEGGWAPFVSPDSKQVGFYVSGAIQVVPLSGGPPRTVVDTLVGGSTASWGEDGYIYFDYPGLGPIMRVRESGGLPEQMTTVDTAAGEADHINPVALPNGRGVVFGVLRRPGRGAITAVAVADLATGRHRILEEGAIGPCYVKAGYLLYVRDTDGFLMAVPFDQDALKTTGEAVEVAPGVGWRGGNGPDLAAADDGTLAYTIGEQVAAAGEPVWVSRGGRVEPVAAGWTRNATEVALSPDGAELAVTLTDGRESNVWVRRRDGSTVQLTFSSRRNWRPMWTRDGRAVAFLSERNGRNALYIRPSDGSGAEQLLVELPDGVDDARLSPDGAWVVYQTGAGNRADLWARRTSGDTTSVPLAVTPTPEGGPAVSPDGRWVAYGSYKGSNGVILQPFPESGGQNWMLPATGAMSPRWAPGGRELFYVNPDYQLVSVEILPDRRPPLGKQTVLFPLSEFILSQNYGSWKDAEYDVAPGAQRFIAIRSGSAAPQPPQLILVENFLHGLKGARPK